MSDEEDMFILGAGASAARSIFSSTGGLKAPSDSSDSDESDSDGWDSALRPKKRGRKAKAIGRGKVPPKKAKHKGGGSGRSGPEADSVFVDDDDEVSLDSDSESDDSVLHIDNDGQVELVADAPGHRKPRKPTKEERRQQRRLRRMNERVMCGDGEEDQNVVETEQERRIRENVEAARKAAAGISAADVDEAAEQQVQDRLAAAAAAEEAAARERALKVAEEAAKRDVDEAGMGVVILVVHYESENGNKEQRLRVRSSDKLAKVCKSLCQKWGLSRTTALLYRGKNVLVNDESMMSQDINGITPLHMRASAGNVLSLKVRIGAEVVFSSIQIRSEDPVLTIREAVARRQGVAPSAIHLELDGEEIADSETGEDLAIDDGTLIDGHVK